MAFLTHKRLLAAAAGLFTALSLGAVSVSAAEELTEIGDAVATTATYEALSQFVVDENGSRVITGSIDANEISQSGWYVSEDNSLYYYYDDGSFAQEETVLDDGNVYLFSADGALRTGWQMVDGKRYYYSAETGQPAFGWLSYHNDLYYIDEEQGKLIGEQEINGETYVFDEYGCVQTGFVTTSDGSLHYYTEDGAFVTGWLETETGTYYFTTDGAAEGLTEIDGNSYYFSEAHLLVTGWIVTDEGIRYAGEDGALATGRTEIDGGVYFFDANGFTQTGLVVTEDGTYFCNTSGKMQTGLQVYGGTIYDFDTTTGKMLTGWQTIGGKLYYFDDTTGAITTGWFTTTTGKYYLTQDGAVTGMSTLEGATYYFNASGVMQTGWITINGTSRYFDPTTGAMTSIGHAAVQLSVSDYKQFDSRWSSKKITYSTIGKVGCLVTALSMKYSYATGTSTTPDKMVSKLSFSGDNLLWSSCTNLGYKVEDLSGKISQTVMQTIYNCLQNNTPVILGAKKSDGGQHYVVITGYTGSTGTDFSAENFVINDPGSSTRTKLSEYLAIFSNLYKLIY